MAAAALLPPFRPLIENEDYVVIRGGDVNRVVQVKHANETKLGRAGLFKTINLIGLPFDCIAELDEVTRKMIVTTSKIPDHDDTAIDADEEETRDNRALVDHHGASQALTGDDIRAKKAEEGVKGLVDQLVQSSATFADKTKFAQEKYIRKKKAKYQTVFYLERPTLDLLCEIHSATRKVDSAPDDRGSRWLKLRLDAVAQMLYHGNVVANSRALVSDRTNGILPAAVLTRLGAEGKVFQLLSDQMQPTLTTARTLGLPMLKERWICVAIAEATAPCPVMPLVVAPAAAATAPAAADDAEAVAASTPAPQTAGDDGDTAAAAAVADATTTEVSKAARGDTRNTFWLRGTAAYDELALRPGTTLLVAMDEPDVASHFFEVWPLLGLGGHFVAYSPFLESLVQLHQQLYDRGEAVALMLWNTWLREYQVLPNRTHPTVNMSHAGGYLLAGIKAGPRSVALASRKRPREP